MNSAKPLLFHFLLNAMVVFASVAVVLLTDNPLGILGLFFLQSMPVFPPEHLVEREGESDEQNDPIGFVNS